MHEWTKRCYASSAGISFLHVTQEGKALSIHPKYSGSGGILMRLFRPDKLEVETKLNQQRAVKRQHFHR